MDDIQQLNNTDLLNKIKEQINIFDPKIEFDDIGSVVSVGDNIANVYGLTNVFAGEIVEFENGVKGVAQNLEEELLGVVILGDSEGIKIGTNVKSTKTIASINVGESLLGRVIDPLGIPIDGKGDIDKSNVVNMPIERKAPGVIFRQPVNESLETGIKAIDSMIPIGKGQRELIIGDRQTGKTSLAVDTIINQKKFYDEGNPVYCIYVAIGQKASTLASIVKTLELKGAMDYTVIVSATSSYPSSMQVYAPFSGTTIGEYFRDTGRNALIIYDDLSKHAIAYREMSLLLRRPAGREAFPGDVFYLHSRLLERSARLNDQKDVVEIMNDLPDSLKPIVKPGGSLTSFPIIETQSGDVSAYIPTNVISITDGQIFLESDLFNSGIRPAINVGISVSRVGSAAQIKPMKKVAGSLKLNQAQFYELQSFAKFGSDLDPVTVKIIDRGKRMLEILKQGVNSPVKIENQISIIYVAVNGFVDKIPIDKVRAFEKEFLNFLNYNHKDVLDNIRNSVMDDNVKTVLEKVAVDISSTYADTV